jgi:hypothetical protein
MANVTVAAGTRATVSPADSSRYGFPSMSVRESRNLRVTIPIESVHPFRSNPYSGSGVFVHLAGWL